VVRGSAVEVRRGNGHTPVHVRVRVGYIVDVRIGHVTVKVGVRIGHVTVKVGVRIGHVTVKVRIGHVGVLHIAIGVRVGYVTVGNITVHVPIGIWHRATGVRVRGWHAVLLDRRVGVDAMRGCARAIEGSHLARIGSTDQCPVCFQRVLRRWITPRDRVACEGSRHAHISSWVHWLSWVN